MRYDALFLITAASSGVAGLLDVRTSIQRRAEVIPAPIVVSPSQYFDGVDGSWSTFNIRVGTPAQSVRVIASTNSPQTNVVQPAGCATAVLPKGLPVNCAASRGGTFNLNQSSTWIDQGWYSLNNKDTHYGFEANLGYNFNLDYGLDTLGLDYQAGVNAPTLNNQTVAAYNLPSPLYLGLFGLGTQPVLYETFGNYSAPSFFQTLRTQKLIPSLSWSYTAGASYRLSAGQYAQLIFGGYDTSRYQSNDVQFQLSADVTRDIVVGVQSIIYSGSSTIALLPTPIYAFIESTDPNIWLPLESCLLFEQAFGLTWDNSTSKYLMNDTLYTSNLALNPTVTFRLAVSTTGGSAASIVLPFSAFALKAAYPFVTNSTYYFPLRRAANSTQYTLGRTFLQEAYLTVDYDRGNFSVSQCTWVQGAASKIGTILSPSYKNSSNGTTGSTTTSDSASRTPVGGIVGGIVGAGAVVLLGGLAYWFWRRKQQKKTSEPEEIPSPDDVALGEFYQPDKIPWTEQDEADSMYKKAMSMHSHNVPDGELGVDGNEIHQLSADTRPTEVMDTDSRVRYELDGDMGFGVASPVSAMLMVPGTLGTPVSPMSTLRHGDSVGSVGSEAGLLAAGRARGRQADAESSRQSSRSRSPMRATSGPAEDQLRL
ncbi:aspartic peptidase domain-containing protein [Tricladium varicosporioides]|nr:aspartic peptidase domain-containing protein [Hymenoscyphus varicosporioides]